MLARCPARIAGVSDPAATVIRLSTARVSKMRFGVKSSDESTIDEAVPNFIATTHQREPEPGHEANR